MIRCARPWPVDLVSHSWPLHRHSSDPGLNLAFYVPVTYRSIGMGFNMGGNFRFNRLAKQLPGAGARQRIVGK